MWLVLDHTALELILPIATSPGLADLDKVLSIALP
jgi:hypothetical protein